MKIDNIDKPPLSIFKNENLVTIESKDLVIQKHNNRKFNKLISLINYLVSSSEKLSKHIHSSNFDA